MVKPTNYIAVLNRGWDVCQITERIQAIATAAEIAGGHKGKLRFGRRADSQSARVARLVAGRAALCGVLQIVTDDIARAIAEAQNAGFQGIGGNGALDLRNRVEIAGFPVAKDERLVLDNGSAGAGAIALVADIGLGDMGYVVVPSIAVQRRVLEEAIAGGMQGVRAMPSNQRHLTARGATEIRIRIGHIDPELFDGILWSGDRSTRSRHNSRHVDTIQRHRVLIVDRASGADAEVTAGGHDARLQVHQFGHIAGQSGQLRDEVLRNGVADLRVDGLELGTSGCEDFDDRGVATNLHLHIEFGRLVHLNSDLGYAGSLKARRLDRDFILARADAGERILTSGIGLRGLDGVGVLAGEFDCDRRDNRSGRIGHRTGNCA